MKTIPFLLLISLFANFNVVCQHEEVTGIIRSKIEAYSPAKPVTADGIILYNQDYIKRFYESNNYKAAWINQQNVNEIIRIIKDSYNEGLLPQDYHLERIESYQGKQLSNEETADLDLILTDATILYARHLFVGKVDQSEIRKGWDIPPNTLPVENRKTLDIALTNMNLSEVFDDIKPNHFMYTYLRNGLAKYRNIDEKGGWPEIPDGKVLKPGMEDDRVPVIRDYLIITGDMDADLINDSDTYDSITVEAVRRFQWRHNLNQDGVIGKGTLEAMNVPVKRRVEEIRINLERARWVTHHLPDDFLVVNIAGYNIRRLVHDSIVYYSRVIVGKHFHETPIFDGTMTYIEINPTWTLPYSIATKETLPKLQKDSTYLEKKNMIILNKDGEELDPSTINFKELSRSNFPYTLRQKAGPNNALGEVKFMFPNQYAVYLHDTPARSLFSKDKRAFSHGCIRLDKKWELFLNLMGDEWNMDRINEVLKSEKTTVIKLETPIEILLLYWTAGADRDNNIFFNKDVYDRDQLVINALNEPINLEEDK
jgi:murein L,D-transpeptidase YcbB/YkuD